MVESGYEVTAVVRSPEKAAAVEASGAVPVRVDLFDRSQVMRAVSGHDAVVNLATKIPPLSKAMVPGAWSENDRIRSEVSRHLVDAALAAGVARYVQESLAFMYPDRGDAWIDEGVEADPPPHARTAVEAEAEAGRFDEQGGTGTVLRFGQFYATDSPHTVAMVKLARRKICPLTGPPGAFAPTIHADDVADAVVTALDAPGGTYNIVDDEPLRQRELNQILSDALGIGRLRFAPSALMRLGGSKAAMLMRSQRVTNARFREVADWTPRTAREGFAQVIKEVVADVDR